MDGLNTLQATNAYQQSMAKPPKMPGSTSGKHQSYQQLKDKAQEFEGFFLAQVLQPMFKDIKPEEPFGGGPGEDMWKSFQTQEYGKAIAQQGGIGLADNILEQMIRLQETK